MSAKRILLGIGACVAPLAVLNFSWTSAVQTKSTPAPKFWALVYVDDQLAVSRIAMASNLDTARKAGVSLGYEIVINGSMAYFFPVPAWSEDQGKAVNALLVMGLEGAFEQDISTQRLSLPQRKVLYTFLQSYAGNQVGGELGHMIRTSPLTSVKLKRTVDVSFKSGNSEVRVPISGELFDSWGSTKVASFPRSPSKVSKAFPDRKELFGLGRRGFSVTINKPTSYQSFDRVLERAKVLFNERQAEKSKELANLTSKAREQLTNDEALKRVIEGGEAAFRDLSPAVRAGLREFITQSPESFPNLSSKALESFLGDLRLSSTSGGFQVFVSFRVGAGTTKGGIPIGYSVSWNINEVFDRG